jgi:hypothetical protein
MPAVRVGYHLRLGSIALVALSLLTCRGGEVDAADTARADGAADGGSASRADTLFDRSRLAASTQAVTTRVCGAAAP